MSLLLTGRMPAVAVSVAAALMVAGCDMSSSGSSDKIVAANYGGISGDTIAAMIGKPFEEESGKSIQHIASGVGFVAKVEAQNQAGKVAWDVIEGAGAQEAALLWSKKFLEPLPTDVRTKLEKVSIPNGVNQYGVLLGTTGYVIACNMEKIKACPSNPADFWNVEAFPGRRAMVSNPFAAMASALVADGVKPNEVFPMNIDRAFKKLKEIRPHVAIWATSGDQQVQIMRDGQVDMSIMWNGRAKSVIDGGVPLRLEWGGSLANPNYMVVLKGGPNTKAAMSYLEWYGMHAKPQADVARKLAYGMSNKGVVELLSPSEAALLPEGGTNGNNQVRLDGDWWAHNADKVAPLWKELLSG
jgi:spermidine/putrescine-binding protein